MPYKLIKQGEIYRLLNTTSGRIDPRKFKTMENAKKVARYTERFLDKKK